MEIETILPLVSGGLGSGALALVLWLIAQGKLIPGSVYQAVRADRDFYRDKFTQMADITGELLASIEMEDGGKDE